MTVAPAPDPRRSGRRAPQHRSARATGLPASTCLRSPEHPPSCADPSSSMAEQGCLIAMRGERGPCPARGAGQEAGRLAVVDVRDDAEVPRPFLQSAEAVLSHPPLAPWGLVRPGDGRTGSRSTAVAQRRWPAADLRDRGEESINPLGLCHQRVDHRGSGARA